MQRRGIEIEGILALHVCAELCIRLVQCRVPVAHQANKDPIIGIRSIYTTKTTRFIGYKYQVDLVYEDEEQEQTIIVDTIKNGLGYWLDGKDTIQPVIDDFNKYWADSSAERIHHISGFEYQWTGYELYAYYTYDEDDKRTYLYFGLNPGVRTTYPKTINGVERQCTFVITITPITYDAKELFGTETLSEFYRVKIPIWSRHQCLVKSSIANNDKNNILGHTRNDPYTPIKYYRLNHDLNKFWIELYETRYHDCKVEFPKDGRDDLIIEAIVCLSSQGML